MRKIKKKFIGALALSVIMAAAVPGGVYAEESVDNPTEDIVITSGDESVSELQALADDYREKALQLKEAVAGMRAEDADVNEEQVKNARRTYESLPDAFKVLVGDVSVINELEESMEISYAEGELPEGGVMDAENSNQNIGRRFPFTISKDASSVTINATYMEDADGDGTVDMPDLTFTSPDGEVSALASKTNSFSNDNVSITADWKDSFVSVDIEGESGEWVLESSGTIKCEMLIHTYTPTENSIEEKQEEEPEEIQTSSAPEKKSGSRIFAIIKAFAPVLIAAIVIVALILFLKFGPLSSKEKKEKKHKPENQKEEGRSVVAETSKDNVDEMSELKNFYDQLMTKDDYTDYPVDRYNDYIKKPSQEISHNVKEEPALKEYEEYPSEVLTGNGYSDNMIDEDEDIDIFEMFRDN